MWIGSNYREYCFAVWCVLLLVIVVFTACNSQVDAVRVEAVTTAYGYNGTASAITVADLNADSVPDIVVADQKGGAIHVLLNDGVGNYHATASYPLAQYRQPADVAVGDLDGDGEPDILALDRAYWQLWPAYNINHTGNFSMTDLDGAVPVGANPAAVRLGDLDGDGDLDCAVVNRKGHSVTVLLSDGAGRVNASAAEYVMGPYPSDLALGDLDGDGDLDMVTTNTDELNAFTQTDQPSLSIRWNDGSGDFNSSTLPRLDLDVSANPYRVGVADLDGDGDQDIVTTNRDDDTLSVFSNDDGRFTVNNSISFPAGSGPTSLTLADLDGDGDPDVVITNTQRGILGLLFNDGAGGYRMRLEVDVGGTPTDTALADCDGDGDLDIVAATGGDHIAIVRNRGNGWFGDAVYPAPVTPVALALADLDGDAHLEVVSVGAGKWPTYETRVEVLTNTGDSGLILSPYEDRSTLIGTGYQPSAMAAADCNGDGALDIVVANQFNDTVSVLSNDGAGGWSGCHRYGATGPTDLVLCDVDGDADIDIVTVSPKKGVVDFLINDGAGGYDHSYNTTVGAFATRFAMGDVDGDGDSDLALIYSSVSNLTVLLNDGGGHFNETNASSRYHRSLPAVGTAIAIGDCTGDGVGDIVTSHYDNTLSLHVMSGDGTPSEVRTVRHEHAVWQLRLADADGDGDTDIFTVNPYDDSVSVIEVSATQIGLTITDYRVGDHPYDMRLADLDGDRDLDMVTANYMDGTITVRANRRNEGFHYDADQDGHPDFYDRFPDNKLEWLDSDGDGFGDNGDAIPWDAFEYIDFDGDGHGDRFDDAFPTLASEWADADGDGHGDNSDLFPYDPNEWADLDGDGIGDNADDDDDGDGITDKMELSAGYDPIDGNSTPLDTDGDGVPDALDEDADGDGVPNILDAFPKDGNETHDNDGDGVGDIADDDDDNDGYPDEIDAFPMQPNEWADTDGDGVGDNADLDDDGDHWLDREDAFPNDPAASVDTDGDGRPDHWNPHWDHINGTTTLILDHDDDNDGVNDTMDAFPLLAAESADFDGDGIGDNADDDDDNDGVLDRYDFDPYDPDIKYDPNLISVFGLQIPIGELVMTIILSVLATGLGVFMVTRKKRLYRHVKHELDDIATRPQLDEIIATVNRYIEKEKLTQSHILLLKEELERLKGKIKLQSLYDEIGELPATLQEELERILEDNRVTEEEYEAFMRVLNATRPVRRSDAEKLQQRLLLWMGERTVGQPLGSEPKRGEMERAAAASESRGNNGGAGDGQDAPSAMDDGRDDEGCEG